MCSVLRLFPHSLKLILPLSQISTCFVPTETNILDSASFLSPCLQELCEETVACSVPSIPIPQDCVWHIAYMHLSKSGSKLRSETHITVQNVSFPQKSEESWSRRDGHKGGRGLGLLLQKSQVLFQQQPNSILDGWVKLTANRNKTKFLFATRPSSMSASTFKPYL